MAVLYEKALENAPTNNSCVAKIIEIGKTIPIKDSFKFIKAPKNDI